ncbi:hypothetical protein PAPHI01_2356 [Pancytospora philotis]|nr:hypothetical protein PAPHI01_2356 [Pancytospora philotis]
MPAGAVPLLMLIYYSLVHGKATASARTLTKSDYADFAELGTAEVSVLENQVLGSVFKCCSEHDCPEINWGLVDRRLPDVDAVDRARYVVFSVGSKDGRPERLERELAKFGYAGRLLLRKLFSGSFIERLTKTVDDTEPQRVFRRAAELQPDGLRQIYQTLKKTVVDEHKKSLLELAEHGSGQDLAIHTVKATNSSKKVTLSSAFTTLVDSWSDDADKRDKMVPIVNDFLKIVLNLNARSDAAQTELKNSIVKHVYASCDTARECFELLGGFPKHQVLATAINKYVRKELRKDPSPGFVRKYLAYIRKSVPESTEPIFNFFMALLPSPTCFHADGFNWSSDPQRFNLISPRWLRGMFEGLCYDPPTSCDVVERMRKYMSMLEYEVFILILSRLNWDEGKKLAVFMLEHQNAQAAREYRQCFNRDQQRAGLNQHHKGVLNLLEYVF